MPAPAKPPILLVKWYEVVKWLLGRVDAFPKNQRFIFGQRLADHAIGILELLVEAAYSPAKAELLRRANRELEVLRWLIRLARDRGLFTARQFEFTCISLTECGRMACGWRALRCDGAKAGPADRESHEPVLRQCVPQPARPVRQARVEGEGLRAVYG
ncbi:MAG: diversity-generating retroelement protein Avd [Planctomycetes bacterium]|nr:diversity-generating retroelement protein Avd [Planctomycetota bacterium]